MDTMGRHLLPGIGTWTFWSENIVTCRKKLMRTTRSLGGTQIAMQRRRHSYVRPCRVFLNVKRTLRALKKCMTINRDGALTIQTENLSQMSMNTLGKTWKCLKTRRVMVSFRCLILLMRIRKIRKKVTRQSRYLRLMTTSLAKILTKRMKLPKTKKSHHPMMTGKTETTKRKKVKMKRKNSKKTANKKVTYMLQRFDFHNFTFV
mmetsp:Transcript_8215/g.13274  ORF Transcript_8215/g.13274 Transcript_8215/m.13274 type:complete len:204 (+) Transcript_8215:389-1000(+)